MFGIIVTLLALFTALGFALRPEDNPWGRHFEWQKQAPPPVPWQDDLQH